MTRISAPRVSSSTGMVSTSSPAVFFINQFDAPSEENAAVKTPVKLSGMA
ncbi:MAG: hypothetical protein ABIO94_06240 [Opitutaceae bacterium]